MIMSVTSHIPERRRHRLSYFTNAGLNISDKPLYRGSRRHGRGQCGAHLGTNMIAKSGALSPELQSLYQQAQGDQNPYLQSILDTNNRRIGDRVNSSVSGAGRYGSGAHTDSCRGHSLRAPIRSWRKTMRAGSSRCRALPRAACSARGSGRN